MIIKQYVIQRETRTLLNTSGMRCFYIENKEYELKHY